MPTNVIVQLLSNFLWVQGHNNGKIDTHIFPLQYGRPQQCQFFWSQLIAWLPMRKDTLLFRPLGEPTIVHVGPKPLHTVLFASDEERIEEARKVCILFLAASPRLAHEHIDKTWKVSMTLWEMWLGWGSRRNEDRIELEGPCAFMGDKLLYVRNSYTKKIGKKNW